MFFSTKNASFTTSWSLDKSIYGLTEVYLNEDIFYQDGYKLTLTNAANDLIDFKKIDNGKNYFQV